MVALDLPDISDWLQMKQSLPGMLFIQSNPVAPSPFSDAVKTEAVTPVKTAKVRGMWWLVWNARREMVLCGLSWRSLAGPSAPWARGAQRDDMLCPRVLIGAL